MLNTQDSKPDALMPGVDPIRREDSYYIAGPTPIGKPILRKLLEQAGIKTVNQNDP